MEAWAWIAAVLTTMGLGHLLRRCLFPDPDAFWEALASLQVFFGFPATEFWGLIAKLIKLLLMAVLSFGTGLAVDFRMAGFTASP